MTSADSPLPLVLLLDEAEARRFEAERPEVRGILALTPGAWGALGPESRALLAEDPITDYAHARITARARRAARAFEPAFDPEGRLHRSSWHVIAFTMQCHAFVVGRVWELLRGPGPWLIPGPSGWTRLESREAAHPAYLRHLRKRYPYEISSPPTNPFFRMLRSAVLRLIRGRGPWLITTRPKLIFGLDKAIGALPQPLRILALEVRSGGLGDYLQLWTLLRESLSGAAAVKLPIAASGRPVDPAILDRAFAAVPDPVMQRGFTAEDRASLAREIGVCEALYDEALKVIRTLGPRCYVNRQESGRQAVIADAAGGAGVPRTVVNYNSFPPCESAVGMHLMRFFFKVRMPESLSDNFIMWSPHLAATSREVYGPRAVAATRPLRLPLPSPESLKREPGPYRVLHASNFTEWGYFFPWIMETSSEFVRDILALERVCDDLPDIALTLRTKPKGECSPEALRRLLPEASRAEVTGTKEPFTQALARADLLVGFGSTTIEEGVLNRKPVLLWGPTRRYRQLPARTTPPTAEDRGTVYAVERPEALAPMIQAILAAHAGRPLTDAEIAPHVWPEGTQDIHGLAETIVAGRPGHPIASTETSQALAGPA